AATTCASTAPAVAAGRHRLFVGVAPGGGDVVQTSAASSLEDFWLLERRPSRPQLDWTLHLDGVAGLRLVARTLELLDAAGTPRLRVAPPWVLDAAGVRHPAELTVDGCVVDTDPRAPWGRPPLAPGAGRCTLRLTWNEDVAYPALVDPLWSATDTLVQPRSQHGMATL